MSICKTDVTETRKEQSSDTDADPNEMQNAEEVSEDTNSAKMQAEQSWLWDFFQKVDGNQARCIICQQMYAYSSISNLRKHLDRKHPTLTCPDDGDCDEKTDGTGDGRRVRWSRVWKFFHRINGSKSQCKICHQLYEHKSSVSNLRKHIERRHPHVSWPTEPTRPTPTKSEDVKKRTPRRSGVWRFFKSIDADAMSVRCKLCSGKYSSATSNMRKHLASKHPLVAELAVAGNNYSSHLKEEEWSADERTDQQEAPADHQFTELYIEETPQSPSPPPQSPSPPPSPPPRRPRQQQHRRQLRQHSRKRCRSRRPQSAASTASEDCPPIDRRKRCRCGGAEPENNDAIDQFGRYVSMLLRRLPAPAANRLQVDLVAQIMQVQIECDSTRKTVQVEGERRVGEPEGAPAEPQDATDPLPN